MIKTKRFEYKRDGKCIIDNQDLTYTLCEYEPVWYNGTNEEAMQELCDKMNEIQLKKERAEAKIRAMEL